MGSSIADDVNLLGDNTDTIKTATLIDACKATGLDKHTHTHTHTENSLTTRMQEEIVT
jgi:hypothetical protein